MFSLCLVSVKILDYVAGHKRRNFSRGHPKVVPLTGFLSKLAFLRVTCKVSAGLLVRGLLALKESLQYQAGFCLSCQQSDCCWKGVLLLFLERSQGLKKPFEMIHHKGCSILKENFSIREVFTKKIGLAKHMIPFS